MTTYRATGINKAIRSRPILRSISLEVREAEFFLLLGPSGSGKTTLLRILAGLETPDSGTLSFLDKDVTNSAPEARDLGFVFQHYALWPHLSVSQNVAFGLKMRRLPQDEQQRRLQQALELVQLQDYTARFPHELSGGQQQRVALARALAPRPRLLLLDEPLSNLDSSLRQAIRAQLKQIHSTCRLTTICVTHDREDAFALADRIGVLVDGELVQVDSPQRLYESPATLDVAKVTGETNIIQGEVVATTPLPSEGTPLWEVTCQVGDATLRATARGAAPPTRRIAIFSRPEAWHLTTAAPLDPSDQIPASLQSTTYEGWRTRWDASLGAGEAIHFYDTRPSHLQQQSVAATSRGAVCHLTYNPRLLLVYPNT